MPVLNISLSITGYMAVKKTVALQKEQVEWVKKNGVDLTKFVQAKIDEARKKKKSKADLDWMVLADTDFWNNEADEIWNDAPTIEEY